MNIAYFGSPDISALLLDSLITRNDPSLKISYVFTQPDRPVGKSLKLSPTPVKMTAQRYHIPVFDKSLKENQQEAATLLKLHEISLCLVFAYGEIISERMLSVPLQGYINVHPSDLPKYRGPTPVAYTLMLGDRMTAVSIIKLTPQMDSGAVIGKVEAEVPGDETRGTLERRLTILAQKLVIETLHKIQDQTITSVDQDEKKATYTKLFTKQHGYIPLETLKKILSGQALDTTELPQLLREYCKNYRIHDISRRFTSGEILYNYYLALSPWPGLWTVIKTSKGEKRLKLNLFSLIDKKLVIKTVQLEGKTEIEFKTFNKSYNIV
jgi:methionyl-tRNA formyltransferase